MKKIYLFLTACAVIFSTLTSCGGSSGTEITSQEEWTKAFEAILDVSKLEAATPNAVAKADSVDGELELKASAGAKIVEKISYATTVKLPDAFKNDSNINDTVKKTITDIVKEAEDNGKADIKVTGYETPKWSAQYTSDYKDVKLNKDYDDSESIPGIAVQYRNNDSEWFTVSNGGSKWSAWASNGSSAYSSVYDNWSNIYQILADSYSDTVKKSYSKGKYTVKLYMGINSEAAVPVFYKDKPAEDSKLPEVEFSVKFNEDKRVSMVSIEKTTIKMPVDLVFGTAAGHLGSHKENTEISISVSLDFEIDYLSKEYKLVKTVPALTDEMKGTNTGNEPASSASAAINSISVDGTKDTPITSVSCDITLTNDKFKAITANTNVSSWFATGNLPAGLNANIVTAVAANAVQATIVISGTPTATSSAVISITIPAEHLASGKALTVTTNANAKFNISEPTAPAPSATISDFTIDGKVNEELAADKKITITLANDKFLPIERDGSDLSGWFAEGNLPNGLTAGLEADVATDAVSLTIIISGTPTAASSAVISITIPAEHLASGKALTVTPNENTKFAITAS